MGETIISALLALVVGAVVGFFVRKSIAEAKIGGAQAAAKQMIEEAKREADALKKRRFLKQRMRFTNFALKQNEKFANEEVSYKNRKTVCCKRKRISIERMKR
ncbi:Ribonuclease Y [Anoxybacillus sp. BCO1]|nr:Ribonuclease Y [Anoxybacillus sp. BCO1]